MTRQDATYGTCECCGSFGPLRPSFVDRAALCAPCALAEAEGVTVAEASSMLAALVTA